MKWLIGFIVCFVCACDDGRQYTRDVCAMVDTSGTYVDRLPTVAETIKRAVLPALKPGDRLILLRIDGESYDEENVETVLRLDARPSRATAQKAHLGEFLDQYPKRVRRSKHTDIRGAFMMCGDYLRESGAGHKEILAFTDLEEDLPPGQRRDFANDELRGVRVLTMDVKRLARDRRDPAVYRERLRRWETLAREKGARDWKVLREPQELWAHLDGAPASGS